MFARRLAQAMAWNDINQEGLAAKTRIAQSSISRMLRGSLPSTENSIKVAKALDVSLDWLCGLPKHEPEQLDPDEEELLRLYRQLKTDESRSALFGVVRSMLSAQK